MRIVKASLDYLTLRQCKISLVRTGRIALSPFVMLSVRSTTPITRLCRR